MPRLPRSSHMVKKFAHSLGLAPQPVAIRTELVFLSTLEVVPDTFAAAVVIIYRVRLADKNRGPGKLLALGADVVLLDVLEVQMVATAVMIASLARRADEDRSLGNLDWLLLQLLGVLLCKKHQRERRDNDCEHEYRYLEQHNGACRKRSSNKLTRQLGQSHYTIA